VNAIRDLKGNDRAQSLRREAKTLGGHRRYAAEVSVPASIHALAVFRLRPDGMLNISLAQQRGHNVEQSNLAGEAVRRTR